MTNKESDNIQQQTLFNESDLVTEQSKSNSQLKDKRKAHDFAEQVLFDNDDYLPVSLDNNELQEASSMELNSGNINQDTGELQGHKRSWLWRGIAALFMTVVTIELVDFFITGFEQDPIVTSLYGLLFTSLTIVVANAFWHELRGLHQFKNREIVQRQAEELLLVGGVQLTEQSNKRGKDFCNDISANLPCDLVFDNAKEHQAWHDALAEDHSSSELVQLYSRVVLTKVDDKALNEVAKFSTEAVVLIALSPVALIDMLIMLSRNLRMINKIAGLYGLKLGYWSRLTLIKQVFVNMAYAGVSELVDDFGSDMLGAELLGKLSTRFAQGLGAGMLTARLGAKTMELCRPIPFEKKPKLAQVRKKVAQQIKSLVKPTKIE